MRILALDWGTVRIGGAISDPEGKIAFALERFIEAKNAVSEIKKLVEENEVEKIIIGLPKALSGNDTASTKSAEEFGNKLSESLDINIVFIDERLSSVAAQKTMSEQGLNQKDMKGNLDNLVALQMLQSYLDNRLHKPGK